MKNYLTSENIFRILAILNYIFYFMSYNSVFLFNAGLLVFYY